MKKNFQKLATVAMLFVLLFSGMRYTTVKAESILEAIEIPLNTVHSGTLTDENREDFLKVNIPSDGNLTLKIKNLPDTSWRIEILNNMGGGYKEFYSEDSSLVDGYSQESVGLPKGTFYIKVSHYSRTIGKTYEIIPEFESSDNYEKEFNDTVSTATPINVNKTYKGIIQKDSDKDIFEFSIPKNGNINLTLKLKEGTSWRVSIQNSAGAIFKEFYTDDSSLVSGYVSKQIGLPKGNYYVVVWPYSRTISKTYELKVGYTASEFYEKEFNDSLNSSTSLLLGNTYRGTIQDESDDDVFKFSTPFDGNAIIVFKQLGGTSWKTQLQNSKGDVLNSLYTNDSDLVKGSATLETRLKKGTYYFVVDAYSRTIDNPYSFYVFMRTPSINVRTLTTSNNKGKPDLISVKGIAKGDVIKVYNASRSGKILASATSKGSSINLSVKQLGSKAGKVYVTVTKKGMAESARAAVSFKAESR